MKVVKKNVYYCEYCNKRGLSAHHSQKHENRCTNNPNRECAICQSESRSFNIALIVEEFKKRFEVKLVKESNPDFDDCIIEVLRAAWVGEPITLQDIRNKVDDCPNCILAIIRQCKLSYHYFEKLDFEKFDYRSELKEWYDNNKPICMDYDY